MAKKADEVESSVIREAKAVFYSHGGVFRTGSAIAAGIHPRTIYAMRDQGIILPLGRGIYRLADMPELENPDLTTVGLKVPKGVVCLISALSFHQLTTEIPRAVYLALPRGSEPPRLSHPPLRIFWFQGDAFLTGIQLHDLDGVQVRIYSAEKSLADCFKYRNKIGLDVALDALKSYKKQKKHNYDEVICFSRICRVERIMRPYLEAIL